MLSDVTISHDMPIVNSYVQVPPCRENWKDAVTDKQAVITLHQTHPLASSVRVLSLDGASGYTAGRATGSKHGRQRLLRLPPVAQGPGTGPPHPDPAVLLAPPAPAQQSYPP
jgi:hypothetical protein